MGYHDSSARKEARVRRIVIRPAHRVKVKPRRLRREAKDKGLATRCQVVLPAANGRRRAGIAESLGCSVSWAKSWANRVVARYDACGVAGPLDRRADNGTVEADEWFLSVPYDLADGSPRDPGSPRPTWTRELLTGVMFNRPGVGVHPATMSRAPKAIGARLGMPRPTAGCPWPKRRRDKRLADARGALGAPAGGHVAVCPDEVDVHLNPRIGLDWMDRGKQKQVPTPGKDEKRYACGALDARTGVLTWAKAGRKNSPLFVAMLRKLAAETYPGAKVIHAVPDNFGIHASKISQAAVADLGGRVVLHFLPPYGPRHNRIERVWLGLHANVTRNHRCRDMDEPMREVVRYLMTRNGRTRAKLAKAAKAA
jgi:transposase